MAGEKLGAGRDESGGRGRKMSEGRGRGRVGEGWGAR